jgi:hypothetical protein
METWLVFRRFPYFEKKSKKGIIIWHTLCLGLAGLVIQRVPSASQWREAR